MGERVIFIIIFFSSLYDFYLETCKGNSIVDARNLKINDFLTVPCKC